MSSIEYCEPNFECQLLHIEYRILNDEFTISGIEYRILENDIECRFLLDFQILTKQNLILNQKHSILDFQINAEY